MPKYNSVVLLIVLQLETLYATHLTLQEFQSVWYSDLDHQPYEDALESFDTEEAFMTQSIVSLAGFEEDATSGVGTLVCSSEEGLSGYERIQQMNDQLNISINSDTSVLHNTEEMTCVLSSLSPRTITNQADSLSNSLKITPLTSYMKIRGGALNTLEDLHDDVEDVKGVDVQLCTETDDISSQAEMILKRIHNERDEIGRSLSLTRGFHWTREDVNHEAILKKSGRHLSDSHRNRINRWREVAENGINAEHQCQTMFDSIDILPMTATSFGITLGHGDAADKSSSASSSCTLSLLAALVAQTEVCSVGHLIQPRLVNDKAQWITQSGSSESRPFWDSGLTGSGQVVLISDSGLDTNNCYFWDSSPGEVKDGSTMPDRRKVIQYTPYGDALSTDRDHGTHVAGSVAGHKSIDGTVANESTGFADGTGRDAKIAFFDIGIGTACCYVPDVNTLMSSGYSASARIHSGSWGAFYSGAPYSSFSQSFDSYSSANDEMLIVMAAGNDGNGNAASTIGSPATAKNVLSVGAGTNENMFTGASQYIAYFSSRGPTQDNRIKPDIVAPGFSILSAGSDSNQIGECDPATYPGTTGGSFDGLTYMSGTSMATPVTSGTLAIIRQYLAEGWYGDGTKGSGVNILSPSSALVKAVLLNGGQEMAAVYQSNGSQTISAMYDNSQGFGLVNLSKSLPLSGTNSFNIDLHDRVEMIPNGQHLNGYELQNTCNIDEFTATLVWIDPAAASSGCTSCLVNDIDLSVIVDGTAHYPNGLEDRDTTNNVERVRLTGLSGSESVTVVVTGTNLSTATQNYALVVTGCFNFAPAAPITPPPTPSPTTAPSNQPSTSLAPSMDLTDAITLTTTLQGGSGQNGNMFDLVALSDVRIVSFDVVAQQTGLVEFEVYTKQDTFVGHALSAASWTLIGTSTITGLGSGNSVPLYANDLDTVTISKGLTQAFYVTVINPNYAVSYTIGSSFGAVYVEDNHLQFLQGSGAAYPFAYEFKPRIFNGAIKYIVDVVETDAPTSTPSIAPSADVTDAPTSSPSFAPSATVTDRPSVSPVVEKSSSPTTGGTINIYAQALQLLKTYDVAMSDDEKNALVSQVRLLLSEYIASISSSGIPFEDEAARRLLQIIHNM
jgi:hypothetical protein